MQPPIRDSQTKPPNPVIKVAPLESNTRGRVFGIIMFIFQIGLLIAYGFMGAFYAEASAEETTYNAMHYTIAMGMFVVLGFGMMLSYYKYGTQLGIITALVVVGISIQLAPLLQKLWFGVFASGFNSVIFSSETGLNVQTFWSHMAGTNIEVSTETTRVTYLSCISILTMLSSVIGRITLFQLFKTVIIYQIMWNLNYFLLIFLCVIKNDHNESEIYTPYFFDQFGSTFVYLFAAFFGLAYSLTLCNQKILVPHPRNVSNKLSLIMCLIGGAFIFATFIFSYSNIIVYLPLGQNMIRMNIIWALTGSVLGTYIGSVAWGDGEIGIKEAIIGIISGGVIMGSAAPLLENAGISVAIGVGAGILSGIYYAKIDKKLINEQKIYDTLGLFGPFLLSSLLGSLLVTPLILLWYTNTQTVYEGADSILPTSLVAWQLIYVALSIAVGVVGGLLSGLACICDQSEDIGLLSGSLIFSNNYGLHDESTIELKYQKVLQKYGENPQQYMPDSHKNIHVPIDVPMQINIPPPPPQIQPQPQSVSLPRVPQSSVSIQIQQ